MKKYILLLILIIVTSCNAQKKLLMIPEIDNRFEIFDNFKYDSLKNIDIHNTNEYLYDGSYIEMLSVKAGKYYRKTYKNSYFTISKSYYVNGIIKRKGVMNNTQTFQVGIWYEFDEEGKLIKKIDYDQPFKFTFEDIIKFCQKENIEVENGPILQNGWHNEISRNIENGQPIWKIEHLKKTDLVEIIKLDGITGEILGAETYDYINN